MNARSMVLATLVLATMTLSGCALSPGSSRSPEAAREAFYLILDDTQDAVGGEWDIRDDPTARGCVIPLWVDGTRYPGLRIADAPIDPGLAIETVTLLWEDRGYSIEPTEVGDATELKGTNRFGVQLILRVSDDGMTLQGESECRPIL